jgi:hypothetical protein
MFMALNISEALCRSKLFLDLLLNSWPKDLFGVFPCFPIMEGGFELENTTYQATPEVLCNLEGSFYLNCE